MILILSVSLRRRMLRQGLDPERVDWLALTRGPGEHMQQYAHIDIAWILFLMVAVQPLVKHCGWVFLPLLWQVLIMLVV